MPAGKICALVGPSGGGKTTSLKMVNRLVEPTPGEVLIDEPPRPREEVVELRRGIGYVIQQVGLFPHLTVARERRDRAAPARLGPAQAARAVRRLLALVGLEPGRFADRYPRPSGGEQQRVGVARALAADPPVLLMDEPFGAVDPIVREQLQNELLRLQGSSRRRSCS